MDIQSFVSISYRIYSVHILVWNEDYLPGLHLRARNICLQRSQLSIKSGTRWPLTEKYRAVFLAGYSYSLHSHHATRSRLLDAQPSNQMASQCNTSALTRPFIFRREVSLTERFIYPSSADFIARLVSKLAGLKWILWSIAHACALRLAEFSTDNLITEITPYTGQY
jgi:hypothetical protein